ncbi:hypothetical protein ATO7_03415 [Oceanococcus atlanticus]|uniref:Lipoprotein n=1 Tax=Oceanococcus atlanticus TaxID=1317117 RepID=A0A1Y1SGV0_9GAMM|nr:hypothetical protein [Oceanococcus atlanticus]ORE88892.1 hypothetical protein ATO7_03415 [Oceanococcus atlanticus]
MTRTTTSILILIGSSMILSACGNRDGDTSSSAQGREETRNIRNTQAIGYSGDAIADKLDAALDANDARNDRLREAD